jgi:hypothetical protein
MMGRIRRGGDSRGWDSDSWIAPTHDSGPVLIRNPIGEFKDITENI